MVEWQPEFWRVSGTPRCLKRIQADINEIMNKPPQGIHGVPHEDNVRLLLVLIEGPKDTPYQGGMFTVLVGFADDYPLNPPKVSFLTTAENTIRFNPHIYANGRVCLSILGTFSGPGWAPAMSLSSVILSIQSLMGEKPYYNEKEFLTIKEEDSENYNDLIRHETIRVAVVDVMKNKNVEHGKYFVEKIKSIFAANCDYYIKVCKDNMHLDGKSMKDPFGEMKGKFQYGQLLKEIQLLIKRNTDNRKAKKGKK